MKQEYLTFSFLLLALTVVQVNAVDSIQQLANATVATSILANQQSSVTPGTPVFSNSIVLTGTGNGHGEGRRSASEKQEEQLPREREGEEDASEEASQEQSASRVAVRASLVPSSSNGTSRDKSAIAANTIDSTTDSTSIASSNSLSHLVSTSVSTDIRTTTANALPAQVAKVLSGTSITSIITRQGIGTTAFPLSASFDAGNFGESASPSDGDVTGGGDVAKGEEEEAAILQHNTSTSISNSTNITRSTSSNVSSIAGQEDEIGNAAGVAVDIPAPSKFNRQYQPHQSKCT